MLTLATGGHKYIFVLFSSMADFELYSCLQDKQSFVSFVYKFWQVSFT